MAGLLALENCASGSSGAWIYTWLYSNWLLQSSVHDSWIGGVRFYVFIQGFLGRSCSGLKTAVPLHTAKATRSSLRPKMTMDSVVENPLARM